MSEFVAVHPETGDEYPVHSRAELVNLIARGYRDKHANTPKRKTGATKTAPATKSNSDNPAPPESK